MDDAPRVGVPAPRRRFRRRLERGASMVEFALVLPVAALFLFAIIDFGMIFGGYTTMRGSVQSAARMASVDEYTYHGTAACTGGPDAATRQMVCTAASGMESLLGTKSGSLQIGICFVQTGMACGSEPPATSGNQCVPGGSPGTYCDVELCAQATMEATTGLTAPFVNGKAYSASSTLRLELGTLTKPSYFVYNRSIAAATPVTLGSDSIEGLDCT
ncbi:MAG: pilus assembly protein [Acidobacteriota bacterium]|nr:pilus assembly protein [Acidobacteriota bacterium]